MTLKELTYLFELKETLKRNEEILQSFQDAVYPRGQNLTGMPHMSGIHDRVGDLAIEIADMENDIQKLKQEIEKTEEKIIEYIETIDDLQTRMIFRLRFVRGLSWKEVSKVMGKYNTPNSVKLRCYKYLCENM